MDCKEGLFMLIIFWLEKETHFSMVGIENLFISLSLPAGLYPKYSQVSPSDILTDSFTSFI